jgi:hypothetical protein
MKLPGGRGKLRAPMTPHDAKNDPDKVPEPAPELPAALQRDVERIDKRRRKREQVEAWVRGDLSRKPTPIADRPHRDDLGAGLTFGMTLIVFTFGGIGLDHWLSTSPLFTLVLAGLGLLGGFVHLVETVSPGSLFPARKAIAQEREARRKERAEQLEAEAADRAENTRLMEQASRRKSGRADARAQDGARDGAPDKAEDQAGESRT